MKGYFLVGPNLLFYDHIELLMSWSIDLHTNEQSSVPQGLKSKVSPEWHRSLQVWLGRANHWWRRHAHLEFATSQDDDDSGGDFDRGDDGDDDFDGGGDDGGDGDDGDDGDGGVAEPVTPPTRSKTTDFFDDLAQRFHTILMCVIWSFYMW